MIPYLLHVTLLLAVCLLFYKLLLQTETFYYLNRWILLSCLLISFLLPLVPVPGRWSLREEPQAQAFPAQEQVEPVIVLQKPTHNMQPVAAPVNAKTSSVAPQKSLPDKSSAIKPAVKSFLDINQAQIIRWLFMLYWAGVAVFGLNLLIQFFMTIHQAYAKPAIRDGRYRIVELSGDKVPCSFLNNIFINPEKYDWETYSQILAHEKVHVRQLHSLDILLAELAIVFQWFNPFAWSYRREVENNLEYLTDQEVLTNETTDKESYQVSLLKVSTPQFSLRIATNYNQSLLKKRIMMMNAKKSNVHTLWKYFMLVPLFGSLTCALNAAAVSKSMLVKSRTDAPVNKDKRIKEAMPGQQNFPDETEGSWFATIKHDKVDIEFKNTDDEHNWSNSSSFLISEFSTLPKEQKGDFTLTRDAGTITFNGKFDGDQGYGHYKFQGNHEYLTYLRKSGIQNTEDQDLLTFLMLNISKNYLKSMQENGFISLTKGQLISMAALKVDAPFIRGWKLAGFKDITPQQLVSAKALHIDSAYVHEIQKAGYPNITFQELVSFKAQSITGSYISGFRKSGSKESLLSSAQSHAHSTLTASALGSVTTTGFSASEVSSAKALRIDSAYIKSFVKAGFPDLDFSELSSFKALGVTADYVKSLQDAGYANLPARYIITLKAMKITPEYIKGFNAIGYKNLPINYLTSFKSQGITPEYIKSFDAIGYKNLPVSYLTSFKVQGITPEYIKGFDAIGYKSLPPNSLISLKVQGITPAFIKGFNDLGFPDVPISEITTLKVTGVTPEYVAAMKQKGLDSKDLRKYISLKNSFN